MPSVAADFADTEAVFVGKAVAAQDAPVLCGDGGWTYLLDVKRVFRGNLGKTIEVSTENNSGRYPLEVGKEYLLFAKRACGALMIYGCEYSAPVEEAAPTILQLEQIVKERAKAAGGAPPH